MASNRTPALAIGAVGLLVLGAAVVFRMTAPAREHEAAVEASTPAHMPSTGLPTAAPVVPDAPAVDPAIPTMDASADEAGVDAGSIEGDAGADGSLALDDVPPVELPSGVVRIDFDADRSAGIRAGSIVFPAQMPLPVCGPDTLSLYDAPGGEVSESIPSCNEISNGIGEQPRTRWVVARRGDWLELEWDAEEPVGAVAPAQADAWKKSPTATGWIRAGKLVTAEVVVLDEVTIALPMYKAEIVSFDGTQLVLEGAYDACEGETCSYEENGEVIDTPASRAARRTVTLELPGKLENPDEAQVTPLFTPLCCT